MQEEKLVELLKHEEVLNEFEREKKIREEKPEEFKDTTEPSTPAMDQETISTQRNEATEIKGQIEA